VKQAEKIPDPELLRISTLTKVYLLGSANLWFKISLGHFQSCRTWL